MLSKLKPPKDRPGFKWKWRQGCDCKSCPWKGNCLGEDTPYWVEVKNA